MYNKFLTGKLEGFYLNGKYYLYLQIMKINNSIIEISKLCFYPYT